MTKGRLAWHVKQFKEMGIFPGEVEVESKKELIRLLKLAILATTATVRILEGMHDVKSGSLERAVELLEDLRWALAQVL